MTQSTYLHCAIFSGKSSLVRQELTFLSPSQKTMWIILATFVSSNAVFKPTGLGIDPVPFLQTHETLRQRMANHKSLDESMPQPCWFSRKQSDPWFSESEKHNLRNVVFLLLFTSLEGDSRPFCWLPQKINWNTLFPVRASVSEGFSYQWGSVVHLHIFSSSHLHIIFTSSHLQIYTYVPHIFSLSLSLSSPAATLAHELKFDGQKLKETCDFGWSSGNHFRWNEARVWENDVLFLRICLILLKGLCVGVSVCGSFDVSKCLYLGVFVCKSVCVQKHLCVNASVSKRACVWRVLCVKCLCLCLKASVCKFVCVSKAPVCKSVCVEKRPLCNSVYV